MDASQSLPDLIAAAQANAKAHEQTLADLDGAAASDAQLEAVKAATSAIEALAVDIFAVFEARMQHHFKRGPFARKLHALLTGAGQPKLAYQIYQYYLAINVLKHGTGSSYREVLKSKTDFFVVKPLDENDPTGSLIDVTKQDFFDGLTGAITESYTFLER